MRGHKILPYNYFFRLNLKEREVGRERQRGRKERGGGGEYHFLHSASVGGVHAHDVYGGKLNHLQQPLGNHRNQRMPARK